MASEYGVPQNRRRACSVGLKNSKTFSFPEPTTQSFITCEQAIGDLPNETIGDVEGYSIEAQINYQRLRGRLRERAKSYAKALANDILR
ncbi:DNA cytosine methyltransferase [Psychrobacter sp. L7]|uniref:DNA cytosine methyltransferase n=1 Tax=Psychrobacter sp. L7 TaxID=1982756 RepID=UPI001F534B33